MKKIFNKKLWLLTAPLAVLMVGCNHDDSSGGNAPTPTPTPTPAPTATGPAPINLGSAGNFVILSSTGITNNPSNASVITGNIGASPITAAAMNTVFCSEIRNGKIYGVDAEYKVVGGDISCFAGTAADKIAVDNAVLDLGAAYTDAAGRVTPNFTELYSGNISGQTLVPGLYKWGTGVLITTDVTLDGGPNDVWVFQIAGGITQGPAAKVILKDGALAKNIFWQSAGKVALDTTAHMEGIVLSKKEITLASGASVNGRLLSQTAVTLIANTVTQPGSTPGTTVDTTAPTVTAITPANAAVDVPSNGNITATFSEAMQPATISSETFTLTQVVALGAERVLGDVTYAGNVATFKPAKALAADTFFTATLTAGVKDLANNALVVKTWIFKTAAMVDATVPTVTSMTPVDAAVNVAVDGNITATFSEAMKSETVIGANFTVTKPVATGGVALVPGDVTYADKVATFNPTSDLAADTTYTATLTAGIMDLAGNVLVVKTWSFKTVAAPIPNPAKGPAPVDLGPAASKFVILTSTGITNTDSHTSVITGNIGASAITAAAMNTVFCSEVNGTIYGVDAAYIGSGDASCFAGSAADKVFVDNAVLDMGTAYTDAAGRVTPDFTELHGGDISGKTLVPGLYKWGTGVLITTDVTLDGGPNDVWIFQIAGGITQAAAAKVILKNGALAKNIFWQSAGVVALNTTAHMEGIVLAKIGITLASGASVNGRLLAQTAVTLISNTVTQP